MIFFHDLIQPIKTRKLFEVQSIVLIGFAASISLGLSGCVGYVPGQQGYWDDRVREMCNKDGGVEIYERIPVSQADIDRGVLPRADGKLTVSIKPLAHPDAPVYAEQIITRIRASNPGVWRTQSIITRRSDGSVVARWVSYTRSGGDVPTPAHDSRFTCPDLKQISTDLEKLFTIVPR